MALKKSDFLVCKECGMYGYRDCFEDKSGHTCKQCTRVYCLQRSLDEVKESSTAVEKTLALVLERLSKVEGVWGQRKEGEVEGDGISKSKTTKDSDKVVQEQRQEKAGTSQRKGRVLLVGDSLVRHVGRNLEQQCVGLSTVCKPGGRIEQIVPEIEKRGKEDTVIVQVGTNNLHMDETEEMMEKYEEMIQRLKEERLGEVVVMGILPRQDLSEALDSKRVEVNRRLKEMCGGSKVRYCDVEFNPWRGGFLGRDAWSASECSRCRHGCATSLHDDEDFKLGGKTVSEVRSLTSCHEKEHKHEGEIIRKKEFSGSEDIILKETRGNNVLKCMYANVRSIVSVQKRAELELYVNDETPDIIGITESWTKPEMADSELALDGYRLFRKDRENQKSEGHGAGGVLLYVEQF